MTEAAIQILNQSHASVRAFKDISLNATESRTSKEVYILGTILIALQVMDGLLTAVGIDNFGIAAEGNPFLRSLMELIGPFSTLIVVKSAAIIIVGYLCTLASEISWIKNALRGMIFVYALCAVIPWTALLLIHVG